MAYLKEFFGVERFTNKFLHVPSSQKDDCHHSHQNPREDEAESNSTVLENRQIIMYCIVVVVIAVMVYKWRINLRH